VCRLISTGSIPQPTDNTLTSRDVSVAVITLDSQAAELWREYLNAAPYVPRTGCAWPHLPHDFTGPGRPPAHKDS
jgi:transposase